MKTFIFIRFYSLYPVGVKESTNKCINNLFQGTPNYNTKKSYNYIKKRPISKE